jgi:hypothetical protein
MRRAIGRRNENDPDSNDTVLTQYINDFYSLTMPNDTKLFESFGTLSFSIDETVTNGVYTFNDVGADAKFINISNEAFISLSTQPTDSASWNRLTIYQDPMLFFEKWGVHNEDVLTAGYPSDLLFYGNELTFRTIPDQGYDILIYGYIQNADFPGDGDPELTFDWWLRYIAYGAARDYAADFRLDDTAKANIDNEFRKQKNYMMTRTHNQKKLSRCQPRY